MGRVAAVIGAFVLGLVLYLLLGKTGFVTWHRSGGMKPALAASASVPTEDKVAPPAAPVQAYILNSFETKRESLVGSDGYSELEWSDQKVSHGEHSLKATFLLRTQFYPSPTPRETPYVVPPRLSVTETPSPTPVWSPRVLFGMGSPTGLRTQDFSKYRGIKIDIFNPEERPINAFLEIADSRGYSFTLPATGIEGRKVTTLGADLEDLAAQDLDLKHIRHVAFHVDLAGRGSAPVLYLDNLRLEN